MRSPAVCLLLQARLIPYSKKYMDILLEVYLRSLSSLRCLISFLHLKSVYLYLQQVEACGSLVTEEHPYAMIIPIEFFLMGFGYHRQPYFASSSSIGSNPTSPSSRCCIAPELLSPESLGIKLKPIKTRVDIDVKV